MSSIRESARVLARILDSSHPSSVLACGPTAQAVAEHWAGAQGVAQICILPSPPPSSLDGHQAHQDLALISDCLDSLSLTEGQRLIGQLRNYGTSRIAIIASEQAPWTFTDFIAMGFRRQGEWQEEGLSYALFTYQLDNYNHRRDWNNPRHWANPEMWGKAWW